MTSFRGFPAEAFTFFAELEADNSKEFWHANKATWEQSVRDPMRAFLDSFPEEFQSFRVFRMNRDVRFSRDKSPYKTMHSAYSESDGGAVRYVQIAASGLFAAAGQYSMARDQLERFRAAVSDDAHGPALEGILRDLEAAGIAVGPGGEAPLKTAPRDYPKDHPRIALLRWKGATASQDFDKPAWLHTAEATTHVEAFWRAAAPLNDWLNARVGRSEEPPQARSRR